MPHEKEVTSALYNTSSATVRERSPSAVILLDMSKALTDPYQLNILQQLIEQNYKQFTAVNGETVRFPYSTKIDRSRTPKIYIVEFQEQTHEVTLSHSISGEIDTSTNEISLDCFVEGHYRKRNGTQSDDAVGAGAYGNIRKILWSFYFKNAEQLKVTMHVDPLLIKRTYIGRRNWSVTEEQQWRSSLDDVQQERKYFKQAYPDKKISKVFPAPFGSGTSARFIMPEVEGQTVKEATYTKKFTMQEAVVFVKEILETLKTLHEQGIVHNDLHAGNMIFTKNGKIKFIDFGFADDTNFSDTARNDVKGVTEMLMKSITIILRYSSLTISDQTFLENITTTIFIEMRALCEDYSLLKLDAIITSLKEVIQENFPNETSSLISSHTTTHCIDTRSQLQDAHGAGCNRVSTVTSALDEPTILSARTVNSLTN
jgi:hypothetical protein